MTITLHCGTRLLYTSHVEDTLGTLQTVCLFQASNQRWKILVLNCTCG